MKIQNLKSKETTGLLLYFINNTIDKKLESIYSQVTVGIISYEFEFEQKWRALETEIKSTLEELLKDRALWNHAISKLKQKEQELRQKIAQNYGSQPTFYKVLHSMRVAQAYVANIAVPTIDTPTINKPLFEQHKTFSSHSATYTSDPRLDPNRYVIKRYGGHNDLGQRRVRRVEIVDKVTGEVVASARHKKHTSVAEREALAALEQKKQNWRQQDEANKAGTIQF